MRDTSVFTIVCTGRGTHKRYTFNEVAVTIDQIRVRATRRKNMPEFKGYTLDGLRVPPYALVRAYDPRAGRDLWRWDCPWCSVDLQLSGNGVRAWLRDVEGRVADLSQHT